MTGHNISSEQTPIPNFDNIIMIPTKTSPTHAQGMIRRGWQSWLLDSSRIVRLTLLVACYCCCWSGVDGNVKSNGLSLSADNTNPRAGDIVTFTLDIETDDYCGSYKEMELDISARLSNSDNGVSSLISSDSTYCNVDHQVNLCEVYGFSVSGEPTMSIDYQVQIGDDIADLDNFSVTLQVTVNWSSDCDSEIESTSQTVTVNTSTPQPSISAEPSNVPSMQPTVSNLPSLSNEPTVCSVDTCYLQEQIDALDDKYATPTDVTNLQAQIDAVDGTHTELEAEFSDLQEQVNTLNETYATQSSVTNLQEQIDALNVPVYHIVTIQAMGQALDDLMTTTTIRRHTRNRQLKGNVKGNSKPADVEDNRHAVRRSRQLKGSKDNDQTSAVSGSFVVAGTGYIHSLTVLLATPVTSGIIVFGIEVSPSDGSDSTILEGIQLSVADSYAVSGHVVFDQGQPETSLSVSPGDVVKFIVYGDEDVAPTDNSVSLVAHIAQTF